MTIYLHNTLSRQKEAFIPLDAKKVRLYACGPTVYNYAHIGNGRAAVAFDLLARLLRYAYGKNHVQYVRNITDIDDKIIDASAATGEPISAITDKFAKIYNDDMAMIGVLPPDFQPKATDYIPQMQAMIAKLIAAGHAYVAEGHVLFHVPSWPDYGQLSRRNRDDMIAGARVEIAPYKKDPADFILWKPSSPDIIGWDSPWGRGRPGWHLECSAMNESLNGNNFDIHTGGEDLIFPHHENEIAQSVCAHGGEAYANYWLHNGYLMVGGKKMSKSLGNFLTVHDLVKKIDGEIIRFALLSAHYRQPFDWTEDLIVQSKRTLDRYYGLLRDTKHIEAVGLDVPHDFIAALKDDLNTPKAFAELSLIAKQLSTGSTEAQKAEAKGALLAAANFIGLLQKDPEVWFKSEAGDDTYVIEKKITELSQARLEKNYQKADGIRADLKQDYGVTVSITATSITWRKE